MHEVEEIHDNAKKCKRLSELEINNYTRRLKNIYHETDVKKREILNTLRNNPDGIIEFQKQEQILTQTIQALKKVFETYQSNTEKDIDDNLEKKTFHSVQNNIQKEESIQETFKVLDKFLK